MLKDIPWRYFDFWLLGAVVLATAFGTTMIRSAVAGNEELVPMINRQIDFALLGIVLIFVVGAIDYRYWMALYRPIFILMSVLLFALFLGAGGAGGGGAACAPLCDEAIAATASAPSTPAAIAASLRPPLSRPKLNSPRQPRSTQTPPLS